MRLPRTSTSLSEVKVAGILVILAWIHRVFFLFSNVDRTWGFCVFYEGDAETFHNFALSILAGVPYDGGIPFHPPAFPYLLAGLRAVLGPVPSDVSFIAIKIVLSLVGSLPVGLIYLLARPYLGHAAALAGAVLTLYSFGLYVLAVSPVSESTYLALLLVACVVWARKVPHPWSACDLPTLRARWPILLGVVLGLLCLTRAEGLLVAVALITILFLRRPSRTGALATASLLLTLLPNTIVNATRLSEVNRSGRALEPLPVLVPITAYGPLNFALANHAGADGGFSRSLLTSQSEIARLDLRDPQHLDLFLHGYARGWTYIRNHPLSFAGLVLKKWGRVSSAMRLGWTQWNVPGGLVGVRRPVDLFVPDSSTSAWILVPLLCGGAWLLARGGERERRWLRIVALLTALYLLTTALFFGYARLGALLLPLWYTLAGALLSPALGKLRLPRRALLAAAVVLFAVEAWGAAGARNYRATGTQLPGAKYLNPHDTMRIEVLGRGESERSSAR